MKRFLFLACALALVATCYFSFTPRRASSATPVNTYELTYTKIWPTAASGNTQDTLSLFLADSTANQFTDSVNVQGARFVMLAAISSGSAGTGAFNGGSGTGYDTITVAHFVRSPYGTFCAGTLTGCLGTGAIAGTAAIANGGPYNTESHVLWEWNPEIDVSGSVHPIHLQTARWRLRSGDLRRYATASSATKAPTGNIQVWAYVWK